MIPPPPSHDPLAPGLGSVADDDGFVIPLCAIFRGFLKRQGLKFTQERARILDAVMSRPGVFGAEALVDDLKKDKKNKVSRATIYRTLKHLQEAGIVSEVLLDSNQAHYELSFGQTPTGYLVCVETGQVERIPSPWLEPLRDKICREHGYEPINLRLIIYGLSPAAQEAKRAAGDVGAGSTAAGRRPAGP